MSKIIDYIKTAYDELAFKVTWPSWKELQSSAVVVIISSMIFALIILVMDFGAQNVTGFLYKILTGRG